MRRLLYILSLLLSITFSFAQTIVDQGVKKVTVDYNISDIKYTATPPPGKITIIGDAGGGSGNGGGSQQDLPGGKDYQIKDKDGNIWNVDENGNVTKGGKVAEGGASNSTNTDGVTGSGNNATVNQYTAKGIKIEWKENAGGQFAYDTAEKTKLPADKYPSVKDINGTTVSVPYKATVNKQTELFDAKVSITDPALKDAKIEFKTLSIGKAIPAKELNKTDTERTYQLELVGAFDYAEEEVIAVVVPKDSTAKQQVISSFRLVHLSPKDINVALVPTDAESKNKLSNIETQTNAIYKKVGVNINFNRDDVFDIAPYLNGNTVIPTEKNTALSTYSSVQQAINKGYGNKNSDRYILFVADRNSDKAGQLGYMRLNGQFGYVFKEGLNLNKTGAHELGHGIFKLEHPFENLGLGEKTTPLLMDYRTGDNDIILSHLDWKQINDPAFKLYAFQSQSSGDYAGRWWYTPEWKPFTAGDKVQIGCGDTSKVPNGTIAGLQYQDKCYEAQFKDGQFLGYQNNGQNLSTQIIVVDENYITKNPDKNISFHIQKGGCGKDEEWYIANKDIKKLGSLDKSFFNITNHLDVLQKNGIFTCPKGTGNENGSSDGFIGSLYGSEKRKEVEDGKGDVVDYSQHLTKEQIAKMLSQLNIAKGDTGIKGKIYITDDLTDPTLVTKVESEFKNPNSKTIAIWLIANSKDPKSFEIKVNASNDLPEFKNTENQKIIQAILKHKEWIDDKWLIKFNPLTAIFDGISYLLKQTKIPERFYNPEIATGDYNPILYYSSYINPTALPLLVNDTAMQSLGIKITDSGKVSTNHIYFAVQCGFWNGIVDQAVGLSDVAGMLSDILDGGDRISQMWDGMKKIDIFCTQNNGDHKCIWSIIKEAHTQQPDGKPAQACQVAETVGVDIANVVTIAISFAKVGKIAQIAKVMEVLDPMTYVFKVAGKVIKPVIIGTGKTAKVVFKVSKAFFEPGLHFTKMNRLYSSIIVIPIDLTPNIENAINKAKELLKNNTKEFEQKVILKTDEAGNIIKDSNGNAIGELEIDGQKVEVLVNENEDVLKESIDESNIQIGSYFDNISHYKQLFKEGKIKELFSELKKTTAYPKMGKTIPQNHSALYSEYKLSYPSYENYPYSKLNPVTDFELAETGYFVRLYDGDNIASKWVFRIEDLRKYKSVDEILENLAIPYGGVFGNKPTKIGLVEVPITGKLRKSIAGPQEWKLPTSIIKQNGGGVQYELLNYDNGWFKPLGDINELFK